MKRTTNASATSVAALKAQTQNEIKAQELATIARIVNGPVALNALQGICEVAFYESAESAALNLNRIMQTLTGIIELTLSRKNHYTDAERVERLQECARTILDDIDETTYFFGHILEHYKAVDNFYKLVQRAK